MLPTLLLPSQVLSVVVSLAPTFLQIYFRYLIFGLDYAIDVGRNVCHGSDSVENAKKEIALWFKEGEVQSWKSAQNDWIYEKA